MDVDVFMLTEINVLLTIKTLVGVNGSLYIEKQEFNPIATARGANCSEY